MGPDRSKVKGNMVGEMESGGSGVRDTVTDHCQHHGPRVTMEDAVEGGHRCFWGLNLNLVQA